MISIGFSVLRISGLWARKAAQPNSSSRNSTSVTTISHWFSRAQARTGGRSPQRANAAMPTASTTSQAKAMPPGVLCSRPRLARNQKTKPVSITPAGRANV